MAESRARQRIRRALEARNHELLTIEWEPPYNAGEMMGYGGGWWITVAPGIFSNSSPDNDLGGMSVDEVLAQIDYWVKPPEPCDCDLTHNAIFAAGIINDPKKPTHGPDCKWHIKYHLYWWPAIEASRDSAINLDGPAKGDRFSGPAGEGI